MRTEKLVTEDEARAAWNRELPERWGKQYILAEVCGCSRAFISFVLTGKKKPTPRFLEAMGWRKVVLYERVE